MRRFLISVILAFALVLPFAACEPKECRQLKELICKECKANSPACRTVRKRRGRDEKKCKAAIKQAQAQFSDATKKGALCTLLSDKAAPAKKK